MALASLEQLVAVGSINVDWKPGDAKHTRAIELLDMASATVLAFYDRLGVAEADIEGWPTFRQKALAAVVAEVASKRMQLAAAPNVDPYMVPNQGPATLKLTSWEKDALSDLVPGAPSSGTSFSYVVERDEVSSWLGGWDGS